MSTAVMIKKKILIDFLYLVENKDTNREKFREEQHKLPLYDIIDHVTEIIKKYDNNYLCFHLGIAFDWTTLHCNDEELKHSVIVLDELFDLFGIVNPEYEGENHENS